MRKAMYSTFPVLLVILFNSCSSSRTTTVTWPHPYPLPDYIAGVKDIGKKINHWFTLEDETFPVANGTIFLKSGYRLYGSIWIKPFTTHLKHSTIPAMAEIVTRPWSEITPENIHDPAIFQKLRTYEIDSITMHIPHPYSRDTVTTFINAGDEYLWRLNIREGAVSIYDQSSIDSRDTSLYTNRYWMIDAVKMISNHDTLTVCKVPFGRLTGQNGMKRKLVRFANNRYNTNKPDNYFSNINEVLSYITREENKRLATAQPATKHKTVKRSLTWIDYEKTYTEGYGVVYLSDQQQIKGHIWIKRKLTGNGNSRYTVEIGLRPPDQVNQTNSDSFFIRKAAYETDSIKLAIPLPEGPGDSTVFVNLLHKNQLLRKLVTGNYKTAYDETFNSKGYTTTTSIIFRTAHGRLVFEKNNFRALQRQLRRYINRKYGNHFADRFTTIKAMLQYIADSEIV